MMKIVKEKWQVRFSPSILGVVPRVRRGGRGDWGPARDAPDHVRAFLDVAEGALSMNKETWPDVATVQANAQEIKWQKSRWPQGWLTIERRIEVAPPIPPGSGPRINSLQDLCNFLGADSPRGLNRRIYKDTDCGASLSLYLKDGTAIHNGDSRWDTLPMGTPIRGFTIQTIVEGSDATVDSDLFWVPCPVKWVDEWIKEMESRASELWEEANHEEVP